jgi:hypothetical protein
VPRPSANNNEVDGGRGRVREREERREAKARGLFMHLTANMMVEVSPDRIPNLGLES